METDSLTYCQTTLEEIRKKIFEIESELLPPQKEKELKRELKRLKVVEAHLIGEVVKLRQLSLFEKEDSC
jgi:hypothetical protein